MTIAHNKTPAVNGEKYFSAPVFWTGARSSIPSGSADRGRGQGRAPSQSLSRQAASSHHPTVYPSIKKYPCLDQTSICWPLEEHHYADYFTVNVSCKRDDPSHWIDVLSPSTRGDALREDWGLCLNCHEDSYPFKLCGCPFIKASGWLKLELGQLGDDDAYRPCQALMICYAREGKSSHWNKH